MYIRIYIHKVYTTPWSPLAMSVSTIMYPSDKKKVSGKKSNKTQPQAMSVATLMHPSDRKKTKI